MQQDITDMFQRDFRTWKYLAVFTCVPLIIARFFKMPQFMAEMTISVTYMFFMLLGIHSIWILIKVLRPWTATSADLEHALEKLENLEENE